jgi:hypothetical protein
MITPTCPKCRRVIAADDINVAADVAFCRPCNTAAPLSEVTFGTGIDPNVDPAVPPKGAWQRASGLGTMIGATHRSVGGAIGTFAFAAFWNGIVSVFVALAFASTLTLLGFDRPAWFPKPVMNGSAMGVGMTIFLWFFLTPFIAVGLAMIAAFLSCLAGRTEVRIRDCQAEVFTGIGSVGWKRKFNTETVKTVRIEDKQWRDSDGDRRRSTHILIELLQGKPIKFGSGLTDERRQFVAAALRAAVLK